MSRNRYGSLHQTTEVNVLPMPCPNVREIAPRVQKGAVPQDIIAQVLSVKDMNPSVIHLGKNPFSVPEDIIGQIRHWIWADEQPTTGDMFGFCQIGGDENGPRYLFFALLKGDYYLNNNCFIFTARFAKDVILNGMDIDLYNHQVKTTEPSILWLK